MEQTESSSVAQILQLVDQNDLNVLQEFLQQNQVSKQVLSQALFQVIQQRQALDEFQQVVLILVKQGAQLDYSVKENNKVTPLHLLAFQGQFDILKEIMKFCENLNVRDSKGQSPLIYTLTNLQDNWQLVQLLLDSGASNQIPDSSSNTPLHIAAKNGHTESLKVLLNSGVDPNRRNVEKQTALSLASKFGKQSCAELLQNYGNTSDQKIIEKPTFSSRSKFRPLQKQWRSEEEKTRVQIFSNDHQKMMLKDNCQICFKKNRDLYCFECVEQKLFDEIKSKRQGSGEKKKLQQELELQIKISFEKDLKIEELMEVINQKNFRIKELENLNTKLQQQDQKIKKLQAQLKSQNHHINYRHSNQSLLFIPDYPQSAQQPEVQIEQDLQKFQNELSAWQQLINSTYQKVIKIVQDKVKQIQVKANVQVFGSFASGLHLPSSDIDLVVSGCKGSFLEQLSKSMQGMKSVQNVFYIPTAAIPILKVKMFVSNHPVSIDISMDDNRHGGVKCVDFVKKVMDRYKFLKEIVVVLKHLLFICNFHEKFSGGLTSYALFLMIASYLQNCEQYPMTFYEAFVGVLNYYVNVFDYLTDIRVLDPDLASIEWQGQRFQYPILYVTNPDNYRHNVAHNTRLDVLLFILRLGFYNLFKRPICECPINQSPLMRVFCDTQVL